MSVPYTQNKVSQAIWSWQSDRSGKQQAKASLGIAIGALLVGCTVASLLFFYNHLIMASIVFSVSALVFLSSQFFPAVYSVIAKIFQKFALIIGNCLTWVFLLPFFFICFPMGRIVQKIKGKDPMQRDFKRDATSYWQTSRKTPSVDEYKRQF